MSFGKNYNHVIIYEPNQKVKLGFFGSWVLMTRNIIKSRDLIWQLFKRDFISNYKQSFLGMFWIFISPLIGIFSWVFMNFMGILNPGDAGVPYPLYVILGSTLWGFFLNIYSATAGSLSSGSSLILQVNFPHEALVVQQIAQSIASFLINLLMIALVLLIFGILPDWKVIFFPLMLVPIFFIGSGIGMIIAVITVVVHDINKIVSMGLGFLMFLTPIIYTSRLQNPVIQKVIKWNPMTHLIGDTRDIILYGQIQDYRGYFYSSLLAIIIFIFSWRLFFLSEHKVAEKL